jgi:putative oxidoreductase
MAGRWGLWSVGRSGGIAPAATVLVRLMVGGIFLSEGIQKFMFGSQLGVGRFERIGIPMPDVMAPLVGIVEVVCGALILMGYRTRLAAVPLLAVMLGALITTKLPILLGHDLGPFILRDLDRYGFWSMAHESRTDLSLFLGSLFLFIVGPGPWSLDARR